MKVEFERGGEENEHERSSFCEVEGPQFISVIFDFFLKEFLSKWLKSGQLQANKYQKYGFSLVDDATENLLMRDDNFNIELASKLLLWFN